ncbi:exodeoxyribonuclease VII small subunit [Helicovermis profundi]|uniref:Exodeoxyribonuclease 7 small subunit n=1 Tax=Helicovermis profundi TaxID=3065157 RepID=A0AAU9E306_9FIRM|nr:exodeoxyribonuclease VII small subunit [Clostridia bacterium S502]
MASKKNNFEDNLETLKTIVHKLENNEPSLDESLKLFEDGIKVYRKCLNTLEKAENKVKILIEENDALVEKNFDGEQND